MDFNIEQNESIKKILFKNASNLYMIINECNGDEFSDPNEAYKNDDVQYNLDRIVKEISKHI